MAEPIYCRWEPSGQTQAIFAFDESKIKRANDGRFGTKSGSQTTAKSESKSPDTSTVGDDKVSAMSKAIGKQVEPESVVRLAGAASGADVNVFDDGGGEVYMRAKGSEHVSSVSIDNGKMYLERMKVNKRSQGKGIGTTLVHGMADEASKQGIKSIGLTAARSRGYNGYYTWPRLGFDGDLTRDIVNRKKNPWKPKEKADMKAMGAKRVSDLMKTPKGREWWKKHGKTMKLTLDVSDESVGMKALNAAYRRVQEK